MRPEGQNGQNGQNGQKVAQGKKPLPGTCRPAAAQTVAAHGGHGLARLSWQLDSPELEEALAQLCQALLSDAPATPKGDSTMKLLLQ